MEHVLEYLGPKWRRLPGWLRSAIVIGGIGFWGFWAYPTYLTHKHDKRLVAIYCGERSHCADHVSADYVRDGRTPWAREAVRIQEAEDDAYEDACPGGPAANGGRC